MVRDIATAERIGELMEALGQAARGPGRVYFTGGATAILCGWRDSTVDVDLKFDPEPAGVFEAIPRIKDQLRVNLELACPADFIPALPGWDEGSRFIAQHGPVEFFHYDLRAQALAKIERGHERDLDDVRAMLKRGLVLLDELIAAYAAIETRLNRYPAIDPHVFRAKLDEFAASISAIDEDPDGKR